MILQDRDYQIAAVDAHFAYFANGGTGNPLICMPTGTGKSVVIARFLQRVYQMFPTQRIMMLTHVKELIEQNFGKLLAAWPTAPAGIYSAGLGRRDTLQKIIFAGIASVAKRAAEFGHVDLILVDEAHLVSQNDTTMYRKFIVELQKVNPYLKVIGYTATGWRIGVGKLTEGGLFTDVAFDITDMHSFNRLLAEGYLCPLVPKPTNTVLDTEGVHVRGGEFVANELQAKIDKSEVTYAALKETMEVGHDRNSWLLFCAGVEHAQHVADMLTQLGVECGVVHSKKSDKENAEVIKAWKSGRLRAVANNNVLTTGIDHPALDLIVMLRPTHSPILWVQMLGRGTRTDYAPGFDINTIQGRLDAIAASQKQNCMVLDFARNTPRLGPINDPVLPRKKGEKAGEAPIKLCTACSTYNHASARFCIYCNAEFPKYGPKITNTAGTDELVKFDMPKVVVEEIMHVTYSQHVKAGKPPMMRVTYFGKFNRRFEYVCFQHEDGFSRRKAREWWQERAPGVPVPTQTMMALQNTDHLRVPTHMRVWVNKQYPEIMGFCYDGTAFNEQPDNGYRPQSEVSTADTPAAVVNPPPAPKGPAKPLPGFDDMDDDIPF